MRISHIVPAIGHEASGPSYSVPRLCEALAHQPANTVALHVLDIHHPSAQPRSYDLQVHGTWPVVQHLGISPAMHRALRSEAQETDIMHNHSLWMMPNVYPALAVRNTNCRLVVSPRGTLSATALRRSRLQKHLMWWLGRQRLTMQRAAMFHATAEHEYADIRRLGFDAPVAIIPNGIDLPDSPPPPQPDGSNATRRLLFLGRIHPIKGLEHLVRAWAKVAPRHANWELMIAGPDADGHRRELESLATELRAPRLRFGEPVYGEEKGELYRSAELYVLPSLSENFAMTVAEALGQGVPCIVSKGAPWSGLETEGCGWWIDIGSEAMARCLDEALSLSPESLSARGARGRNWMRRDFSWERIADMMAAAYQWLLNGGTPPSWVRTD